MGNHAAWVYPLSLLYKIYPDVHWLLAVQAVALALGHCVHLARHAGHGAASSSNGSIICYPGFNVNLFEFHPEVMALPVFLGAVLAARKSRTGWFCLSIISISGMQAVLSNGGGNGHLATCV